MVDWKSNGNGRPYSPYLKAALLLVVVVLLAVLVYRQVDRMIGPKRPIVVVKQALAAGAPVSAADLETRQVRARRVPAEALADPAQAVGRRLTRPRGIGEALMPADLAPVRAPVQQAVSLAEALPAGRVLTSARVALDLTVMDSLRFGDRLEILAQGGGVRRGGQTAVVASDAYFVAWVDPRPPPTSGSNGNAARNGGGGGLLSQFLNDTVEAAAAMPAGPAGQTGNTTMLLGLYPRDVLPVSEAEARGARLSVVLHGKSEVDEGKLLELDGRSWPVEYIVGARRGQVDFLQQGR